MLIEGPGYEDYLWHMLLEAPEAVIQSPYGAKNIILVYFSMLIRIIRIVGQESRC